MNWFKAVNNLSLTSVFYVIIICYVPYILRGYGWNYIDNFWLGLSANIISIVLIFSIYLVLTFDVIKDLKKDKNLSILFFSVFSIFLVLYITVMTFSENVIFVGGKYFAYVIYSYLIYSLLFVIFLASFALRFYYQLKKA